MSDVAREAGVSLMTVSRVINNKDDVSSETRQRVLDVITSLGYSPSAIARSLATKETRTIGLVLPDVANPFFADITRGVEYLAYSEGYHVFLCNTEEDAQRELSVVQSLEQKRIDGLILCSSRLEDEILLDLLKRLPAVVMINRRLKQDIDIPYNSVSLDEAQGGRLATEHLIRRGHQRIGFLAGPSTSYSGAGRSKGYLAALQQAGVQPEPGWASHCAPSVEGGEAATRQLLANYPELTALFCYNDLVAVGALQACKALKRRVPQDLAVVGFDDIPLSALVSPTLTTCHVPRYDLGAMAVEALIARLRDCPDGCQQSILQTELIIRDSAP